MSPKKFIEALRETDEYIRNIYMHGGCYQFALLLCKIYKGAEIYMSGGCEHCITKIGKRYYDIDGMLPSWRVKGCYHPMTKDDEEIAKQWSFSRNFKLKITECPFCEEPITFPLGVYKVGKQKTLKYK